MTGPNKSRCPGDRFWRFAPWVAVLLALAVYGPTLGYSFINYDDPLYLNLNPAVMKGFTLEGLREMWTTFSYGNWQPVTLMSHALDVRLFGLHAGPHHAVSIMLHIVNAALVYLVLVSWSGNRTTSLAASILWLLHPLNVDAVTWISQRKTLLSAMFGLLTALAYLTYRRRGSAGLAVATMVAALMGLLCKGVLVALPLVLWLMVDVLRPPGIHGPTHKDRWVVPAILVAAVGFGLVVMKGQAMSHSVVPLEAFPLAQRFGYALENYVHYLTKLFLPFGLAVHYPPPVGEIPLHRAILAGILLLAATLAAWRQRATRAWLTLGWFWFVLLLAPLSGILATGQAIKTDRFAYLPSIGICLIVASALSEWEARFPRARWLFAALVLGLALRTRDQVHVWRNSESVYRHAIAVAGDSPVVRNNLAVYYIASGRMEDAAVNLVEALRMLSRDDQTWSNLAIILASPEGSRAVDFHLAELGATSPQDLGYRLVRLQIALVRAQSREAREAWTDLEGRGDFSTAARQRAWSFRTEFEKRHGPLFPEGGRPGMTGTTDGP